MTIKELKKGIAAGKVVTFMGENVNIDLGSYHEHFFTPDSKLLEKRDFLPSIIGIFHGSSVSFDLDKSGLVLSCSGNISWKHIENK